MLPESLKGGDELHEIVISSYEINSSAIRGPTVEA